MSRSVWIVEIHHESFKAWEPCAEAKLAKADAEKAADKWAERNPHDDFRVTRYVPAPRKAKKS